MPTTLRFPEEKNSTTLKPIKMKPIKIFLVCLASLAYSCDDKTTLQEYYVENQNNRQFLALDVPASLLTGNNSRLNAEQKATLETVRKVNLLAFPLNEETRANFEEERARLSSILGDEKYQPLIKYGGGTRKAELYYIGEDDAIDEFIVYGFDEEKGFGVARVLGDNMNPDALIKLMKSFEEGDLNIEGLQSLTGGFQN